MSKSDANPTTLIRLNLATAIGVNVFHIVRVTDSMFIRDVCPSIPRNFEYCLSVDFLFSFIFLAKKIFDGLCVMVMKPKRGKKPETHKYVRCILDI